MRKTIAALCAAVLVASLMSGCSVINKMSNRSLRNVHVSAIMADGVTMSIWGLIVLNPYQDTIIVGRPASVTVIVRFDNLPPGEYTARAEFSVGPAPYVPTFDEFLTQVGFTRAEYEASEYKTAIDEAFAQMQSDMTAGWKSEDSFPVEGRGSVDSFSATAFFTVTLAAWTDSIGAIRIYLDDRLVYELPIQFVSPETLVQSQSTGITR